MNNLMTANHLIATSIQEELNDKIKLLEVSNETAMNENENLKVMFINIGNNYFT